MPAALWSYELRGIGFPSDWRCAKFDKKFGKRIDCWRFEIEKIHPYYPWDERSSGIYQSVHTRRERWLNN